MKLIKHFPELCIALAVSFGAVAFFTPLFAQDATREDVRSIIKVDGNPNTLGTFGRPGDLVYNTASGALWVKTGASGTTSWTPAPILSSATNNPTTGSFQLTGTSVKIFLTGSTGLEVKSGTTAPF